MDDLIDRLVSDLRPIGRHRLSAYLAVSLLVGLVCAIIILLISFGLRPGMHQAVTASAFWIKFSYNGLLLASAVFALKAVARPDGSAKRSLSLGATAFVGMSILAFAQLWQSPTSLYPELIFGISAVFCPFLIVIFALPALIANVWFLRRAAPTRPALAGFIAGMCSGTLGAWVYAWGCVENGMPFVALWYSIGILLTAAMGAVAGRGLLRW